MIMPETNGDLACSAAERIRQSVARHPFETDHRGSLLLDITVSAGVATFKGDEDTAADMLKRADDALYRAKTAGRNQVYSIAA